MSDLDNLEIGPGPHETDREIRRLRHALAESLKLQSHYADQLNTFDSGMRRQFASVDEWLSVLDESNPAGRRWEFER